MLLTKEVNEIHAFSTSEKNLENKLDEVTSLVKQLAVGKDQITRICCIYTIT